MIDKARFLNGNMLKIIAAVTMLFDHIGRFLLPNLSFMTLIGRLAFPIFAFMIAEGARYTKNRLKYILQLGILGGVWQIYLLIALNDTRLNILITFTLSLGIIYLLDLFKISLFDTECSIPFKALFIILFVCAPVVLLSLIKYTSWFTLEYGFYGCMVAVFASAPSLNRTNAPEWLKKFDVLPLRILCMCVPLLIYCFSAKGNQYFSLISPILLLLYSGKRGTAKMKYFFYIFYPAHLIIIHILMFIIY